MKIFNVALAVLSLGSLSAAQSYYDLGWELLTYTVPFRVSPVSFGPGSSAEVSAAIITETYAEGWQDALPDRGLFGKGWPSGNGIDPARYIQFAMNPAGEVPLFIQYVQIPLFRESPDFLDRGEHGPRKWSLRWSRDNYAADLGQIDLSSNMDRSQATFRVDLWQNDASTEAITFRLYGYDSPSAEGSGGIVVVNQKLFILAGVRRPRLDMVPKVTQIRIPFANVPTYLSIDFEDSYGKSFGLEKSADLSVWIPTGVKDRIMEPTNNSTFSLYMDAGKDKMFYRVVER